MDKKRQTLKRRLLNKILQLDYTQTEMFMRLYSPAQNLFSTSLEDVIHRLSTMQLQEAIDRVICVLDDNKLPLSQRRPSFQSFWGQDQLVKNPNIPIMKNEAIKMLSKAD